MEKYNPWFLDLRSGHALFFVTTDTHFRGNSIKNVNSQSLIPKSFKTKALFKLLKKTKSLNNNY